MSSERPLKLLLGVGSPPIHEYHMQYLGDVKEWTLVDIVKRVPNQVQGDMRSLPFPPDSVDAIYASHVLEHLPDRDIRPTLKEFHRVLKQGAWLHLNVPNIEWACWKMLHALGYNASDRIIPSSTYSKPDEVLKIFYGSQSDVGEYHYTGFWPMRLLQFLDRAEFRDVKLWTEFEAHDMECVLARCLK